jgi:hypothetical protein
MHTLKKTEMTRIRDSDPRRTVAHLAAATVVIVVWESPTLTVSERRLCNY